jgi:predicted transposase YbfD/YdcC
MDVSRRRDTWLCPRLSKNVAQLHWPQGGGIGKVIRAREIARKTTTKTAYYLLSAPLSVERLNEVVRSHWGVESLHWRLDVDYHGCGVACWRHVVGQSERCTLCQLLGDNSDCEGRRSLNAQLGPE